MADISLLGIQTITVFLIFGATFLAYSISRKTGGFRAWYLIILGLLLLTERNFVILLKDLGFDITFGSGNLVFLDQALIPLFVAVIFVLAMYDLNKIFSKQRKDDTTPKSDTQR